MVVNIKAALKAFKEVNRPQEDKIALFDKLIGEIRGANNLVADDGELYIEIQISDASRYGIYRLYLLK